MTHITEHHSEAEWESDNRHWGWVCFLVGWDTVSIDNHLEHVSQFGDFVEGRWFDSIVVFDGSDFGSCLSGQFVSDILLVLCWGPEVSD